MMARLRSIGLFTVLICVLIAPTLAAAKAVTYRGQFTGEYDNTLVDCTGEEIHISGEYLFNYSQVFDPHGGYHTRSTEVYHNIRGTSSSGEVYKAVGASSNSFYADTSDFAPYKTSFTQQFNLIGQGSAANLRFGITFLLTTNANGETTAEVNNASYPCE